MSEEKTLNYVWNNDAPLGQAWFCPDCSFWVTLGGNAGFHAKGTGHRLPVLKPTFPVGKPEPDVSAVPATGQNELKPEESGSETPLAHKAGNVATQKALSVDSTNNGLAIEACKLLLQHDKMAGRYELLSAAETLDDIDSLYCRAFETAQSAVALE